MHNVDIEVFPIAKTAVDRESVQKWLDHLGANEYEIPSTEACSDPALLIALAAKRCYMSFEVGLNKNVTKVRKDIVEYLDNVLKSGHGSVCEHASWTFAIEGVSRVFTAEMNRHRAGVGISEGSLRYIRFDDIGWWMPGTIKDREGDDEATRAKKAESRDIFAKSFKFDEDNYKRLCEIWEIDDPNSKFTQKKILTSCFRRIVGMGVATGGVWTMNMRAARHIIALRSTEHAEEEIAYVFGKIASIMTKAEPALLGDFVEEDGFWAPKYKKI